MTLQLLKLHLVTKSYGPKCILDSVSLTISQGDRLALIGANGAGKSTLAKLMLGLDAPDQGVISRNPALDIAYLPQETLQTQHDPLTVDAYLRTSVGDLKALEHRMEALEQVMASPATSASTLDAALAEYGNLQEVFERRGGYTLDHRLDDVLTGLGLAHLDRSRDLTSLSGGELRRVALAALLIRTPDLLILDEPTNHLDSSALEWLETYLAAYPNALLVISHERNFLDRVTNGIVEVSEHSHQVTRYAGNYADYLTERDRREKQQQDAYEHYKQEMKDLYGFIKKQTFALAAPPPPKDSNKMAYDRHGESVAKAQARRLGQAKLRLEQLQKNPVERPPRRSWAALHWTAPPLLSDKVIEAEGISHSFNNTPLLRDISLMLCSGDRVALEGPNGCGKSTLAKLLVGELDSCSGTVRIAPQATLVYVEQDWSSLNPCHTVLEEYRLAKGGGEEGDLRSELHRYGLFTGQDVFRTINTLSSGMKQKLKLAKAFARHPNVLVMDEPTNHLDLLSVESLERALMQFDGTLLLISHDRRFVQRLTTRQWIIQDGALYS